MEWRLIAGYVWPAGRIFPHEWVPDKPPRGLRLCTPSELGMGSPSGWWSVRVSGEDGRQTG